MGGKQNPRGMGWEGAQESGERRGWDGNLFTQAVLLPHEVSILVDGQPLPTPKGI